MRLVYKSTGKPVLAGDIHTVNGFELRVAHTPQPHKPDSEGKIDFYAAGGVMGPTYGCSVIGAEWIEREDRPLRTRDDAYSEFRELYLTASADQSKAAADPAQAWDDFIDLAIRHGRAPAYATAWSLAALPYNAPGHECPETRRFAMTVADAYAREDSADRTFFAYSIEASDTGLECWRLIDGIDRTISMADDGLLGADGLPVSYTLDWASGGSTDVTPAAVVYMQRTRAERGAQ